MRWRAAELIGLLIIGTGCASQSQPGRPAPDPAAADHLAALATAALEGDGGPGRTDSLYAPDAEVIADGRRRTSSPRYAGVGERGRVVVGSTRVDVVGEFAWASLRYQWLSADENRIAEGQATLVLMRFATGPWRIVHAHSSQAH
jgi:hypothetical protein